MCWACVTWWPVFPRAKRVLGVCYVVVKVSMLAVVEIGVFPLVCGWWLDVCSLTLLDTSLQVRGRSRREIVSVELIRGLVLSLLGQSASVAFGVRNRKTRNFSLEITSERVGHH